MANFRQLSSGRSRRLRQARHPASPTAIATLGVLLFQVRYFQGRLEELVEQSVRVAGKPDGHAVYRAAAALALIESGRTDEARRLARCTEDFQTAPWDWFWSVDHVHLGRCLLPSRSRRSRG